MDANAQRTHLTERRTQAIAQRTPLGGLYRTYGNGHGPNRKHTTVRHNDEHRTGAMLDTKHCHTRAGATALQYLANTQTKASLLRHKICITTLVTQQYTTTQQVYTKVHN